MATRRRQYSMQSRREAVRLMQEADLSYPQVGRDLGVDRSVIRAWVKRAEAGELEAPSPKPRTEATMEEELRRLRRENAILQEERDTQREAAALFTKESQ